MGTLLLAVAAGLTVALIGFVARKILWPALQRGWRWARRGHDCRSLLELLRFELIEDIDRLAAASLASREGNEDGTERTVYRFGRAHARRTPELPTLRRAALDDAHSQARSCLGDQAGLLDDAVAAVDRYAALDIDRFRDAWNAAMNPTMERMVIGDLGHRANQANSKMVVDTDHELSRIRAALVALLDTLPG